MLQLADRDAQLIDRDAQLVDRDAQLAVELHRQVEAQQRRSARQS